MNSPTVDIAEFEQLAFKMEQLANMALAIETAMFESPNSADNYAAAMNMFVSLAIEHSKNMNAFFEASCPTRKDGAA